MITAWVAKFALDCGVYAVEGSFEGELFVLGENYPPFSYRIGTEIFLSETEAIAHAERMRQNDLEFHRQEIERLENLEF